MSFPLESVLTLVRERALRLLPPLDPAVTSNAAVVEAVVNWCERNTFELVRTREQLATLWKEIREKQDVMDFLIPLTTQLRFVIGSGETNWAYVVDHLVSAYTQYNQPNSAIDEGLLERMPKAPQSTGSRVRQPADTIAATYQELLEGNPWFVTILLLVHANIARHMTKALPKHPHA